MRTTSPAGISLIQRFEGCRLTPYRDIAGVWTVGYGHTATAASLAATGITLSQGEATELLRRDLRTTEAAVNAATEDVELSQSQFDALVSLTFNIGVTAFRESTLLKRLLSGDVAGAAAEFGRWVIAGKKVVPGLVARRKAEAELFSSPRNKAPA